MFKKIAFICSIAFFSSSLTALAGCPEDIKAAEQKLASAVADFNKISADCNKITRGCPAIGKTKSLYESMMRAGSARGAAQDALDAVKKRCAQKPGAPNPPSGGGKRLPGFL